MVEEFKRDEMFQILNSGQIYTYSANKHKHKPILIQYNFQNRDIMD